MKQLSQEEIKEAHKIMGDASIIECQEIGPTNRFCNNYCCRDGSYLFPGEEEFLKELQQKGKIEQDIEIAVGMIRNCFDNTLKQCRLGDNRTLSCKLFPMVSWRQERMSPFPEQLCPAFEHITDDFRERTSKVIEILFKEDLEE
jgi:hypothetical protein